MKRKRKRGRGGESGLGSLDWFEWYYSIATFCKNKYEIHDSIPP